MVRMRKWFETYRKSQREAAAEETDAQKQSFYGLAMADFFLKKSQKKLNVIAYPMKH